MDVCWYCWRNVRSGDVVASVPTASIDQNCSMLGTFGSCVIMGDVSWRRADDVHSDSAVGSGPDNK